MLEVKREQAATGKNYRRSFSARLRSWSATSQQAAIVDAARSLFARAEKRAALLTRPDNPWEATPKLDELWSQSLRVRLVDDLDAERSHWLHVEGHGYRLTAHAGPQPDDGTERQITVVSFVGNEAEAVLTIRRALLPTGSTELFQAEETAC